MIRTLNHGFTSAGSCAPGLPPATALSAQAQEYYERSVATFETILEKIELDLPLKIEIVVRKADALRKLRQFEQALDALEEILRANPNSVMLNVQVSAAMAYQNWAGMPKKEALYERALLGARKDEKSKKNIIWGWRKIGDTTSRYPKFKDVFHEARYNQALCRLKFAESK